VIIPTHNRPALTAAAIASVQAQTYDAWHLYVVDDASDDDTAAHVQRIADADPRITVIRRTIRGGGNPARQTALEASSAPLVALCDSDDLWNPAKLERQVERLDAAARDGHDIAIVLCWHDTVDADGSRRGDVVGTRTGRRWHPFTAYNTSTPLIRRRLLEEVGGFAASPRYPLTTTDHVELFLRLTRAHATVTVPEVLAYCRQHHGVRNSDVQCSPAAAREAEALLLDADVDDRPDTRAWLHAWVAGRYITVGDNRRAKPFMTTALRAGGPATGARIVAHYGPWAVRELVRQRRAG